MNQEYLNKIADSIGVPVDQIHFNGISGGDIHEAYLLSTHQGNFFLKTNSHAIPKDMFAKEANGLNELRKSTFTVPGVIAVDENYLVLEYLGSKSFSSQDWIAFGQNLASMHQITQKDFGWKENNYIGSLVQSNRLQASWHEFFVQERLEPQLKLAVSIGHFQNEIRKSFEKLYQRIEDLFPKENPALLHGDLWSGNVMCSSNNSSCCIFDPAVYYGHREMDLAMTQLFGGFHPNMLSAYQEVYPLEVEYGERVELCNLYPLLVHVNLFGGAYTSSVKQILNRFIP